MIERKFLRATRRSLGALMLLCSLLVGLTACAQGDPARRLERAATHYAQGDYRSAVIEVRNVLQRQPENPQARLLLGRASLALGDLETAARELARAREMGVEPQEVAFALARALTELGRAEEALAELERVPEADRDADWYALRGDLRLAGNWPADAAADFEQALAMEPGHYSATLGEVALALQRQAVDEAYQLVEQAIAREPDRPEAYAARAFIQLQGGNAGAAERDFVRAAERFARGPRSNRELGNWMVLAQVQLLLGRRDALDETVARVGQRLPEGPARLYVEAAGDYLHGRHADANSKLQRALAQAPNNPQLLMLAGAVQLALGNLGQADQHLVAVLNQRPNDITTIRLLAETRRRQGRPGAALELLRRTPAADQNPFLLAFRGVLHLEAGEAERGVEVLERAAQALGADQGVVLQLARAYFAAGRGDDATRLLRQVLGTAGGSERSLDVAVGLLEDAVAAANVDGARARAAAMAGERGADPDSLMGVALFYQAIGDSSEARLVLRRAVDADPGSAPATLALAGLAAGQGNVEEARELYRSLTERSPENFAAWIGLARLAAADQAMDEAAELLDRAVEAAPGALAPHLFAAQLALTRGDLPRAESAVAAARRIAPENSDVLATAGAVASRQRNFDTAIEQLQRAADAQPQRADRWHELARAQAAHGQVAEARASLERAASLAPANGQIRYDFARIEQALGNAASARRLAQALQADFPLLPEAYTLEASILVAAGEHARAAELFDRAFELRPSFESALLSYQSRNVGGLDQPTEPLRRWLEIEPAHVEAWFTLGDHAFTEGRPAEAIEAYGQVLVLAPDHPAALNNVAWLYQEMGDDRSLEYARRAYEQAPDSTPILDTYGWVLLQRGDAEAALPHLRQAARAAADVDDIQYRYAVALVEVGERAEARAVLEQTLAHDRDFEYRAQAEALLAEL